jgi:iron complex outermembrane receptor protein
MTKPLIIRPRRQRLLASLSAAALVAAVAASAAQAQTAHRIDIAAGSLESALDALANQTHEQMLFTPDVVSGRRAAPLHGDFTAEQALARLLANSPVKVRRAGPNMLVLTSAPALRATPQEAMAAPGRPFAVQAAVPVDAAPLGQPMPAAPAGSRTAAELTANTVEELKVTGSHIRGGRSASPLVVIDREALDRSGFATVAEAVDALPQNFAGQATEGTLSTRADNLGSNVTFATGVNLRGLGPSATLVLVNGRRVAGSGAKGDFVDLSTIPAIAIERVEVLLDGASAIYGSDAVGGVVNVILRKNYEGAEVRVRAGGATAGGPEEAQVGLALGKQWDNGGLFASYEGYRRTALTAADRPYTASADLRPFGGSDRRELFSFPGNIVGVNPATGLSGAFYGIPAGQSGVGLTPASFTGGVINRQTPQLGLDILPDQREQSLYVSGWRTVAPWLEVSGDLRYGFRKARAQVLPSVSTLTVTRANPFYVSPIGASSEQILYSFAGELGNGLTLQSAESLSATLGTEIKLPHDWRGSGYLAFSQEIDERTGAGILNALILNEALGTSADRPDTAYSPARDGFFNPFAGQGGSSAAVLKAIGSGFSSTRPKDRAETINLQADGDLFTLPGGPVKAAIGGQFRREIFIAHGSNYTSTPAPVPTALAVGDRTVSAAFAEVRVPIVGAPNRLPGVETLELSLAGRVEDYSDFGRSFNPKAGLLWAPSDELELRSTYGRSFRAPTLRDLNAAPLNNAINLTVNGAQVSTIALQGGNPTLRPETATSWTVGGDYRPAWAQGLHLSATWFQIQFQNRIDRPVAQNLAGALSDPRFVSFIQRLDPAHNPADLAKVQALLASPATLGTTIPAQSFAAIIDLRLVNTGVLDVSGFDLSGSYGLPAFGGHLSLAANGSRLLTYSQRLTPNAPSADLVGHATYPAKLKTRLTADWSRGPATVGVALNTVSAFTDSVGSHIAGQATVDLQGRLIGPRDSRWAGLTLAVNVRNLFDKAPPFYDNPLGLAYDPANGDVIGRFVSLQLTKAW